MTTEEAQISLAELFPWMRESWAEGWQQYKSCMHPEDDSRCRSTVIQMRAIIAAKRTCGKISGLKYIPYSNIRHLFEYKERAILQFKKLDEELRSRNNHTKASRDFYEQAPLPGLPELPHFTCGYVPNRDHTDILSFQLTFPRSVSANSWELDITGEPVRSDQAQENFEETLVPSQIIKARNGNRKQATGT